LILAGRAWVRATRFPRSSDSAAHPGHPKGGPVPTEPQHDWEQDEPSARRAKSLRTNNLTSKRKGHDLTRPRLVPILGTRESPRAGIRTWTANRCTSSRASGFSNSARATQTP
jgi:hypothetical protein